MTTPTARWISKIGFVLSISAVTPPGVLSAAEIKSDTGDERDPARAELTDSQILGVLAAADESEMAQAAVAESRAQAESVRAFAALMVRDHTAMQARGRDVARSLGVSVAPSGVSENLRKHGDEALALLHGATTANFDHSYMVAQAGGQAELLRTIGELSPKADAAAVKSLLVDTKTQVEQRLAIARNTLVDLEK